ncbi:hypothetical protein BC628DRAFT_822134 [Trametes gibbosa]|nr:hypothetical protein BC628DRAFT_822134 [Trametes gibbosa]
MLLSNARSTGRRVNHAMSSSRIERPRTAVVSRVRRARTRPPANHSRCRALVDCAPCRRDGNGMPRIQSALHRPGYPSQSLRGGHMQVFLQHAAVPSSEPARLPSPSPSPAPSCPIKQARTAQLRARRFGFLRASSRSSDTLAASPGTITCICAARNAPASDAEHTSSRTAKHEALKPARFGYIRYGTVRVSQVQTGFPKTRAPPAVLLVPYHMLNPAPICNLDRLQSCHVYSEPKPLLPSLSISS